MPLIILNCKVENRRSIVGLRGKWGKINKHVLQKAAWRWHKEKLESHFTPGNNSRYQMQPRTRFYRTKVKIRRGTGQGKYVDLILSGRSLRALKAFATVSGTATAATLTMKPPGYFTRPFVGSYRDPKTGRQKVIRQQPDKVAELKRISPEDRAWIVRNARRDMKTSVELARRGIG